MIRPYPAKIPKSIQYFFKQWVWSFPTQKKEVYLTFDDGPIPQITPWVLSELNKYNAKATFFCIGENIKKHPAIFQEILNNQHTVGNHTFNHLKGWHTNTQKYIENTELTEKLLPKNTQKLFRPPYGKITHKQSTLLRKLGFKIIMWNVLSGDFDQKITAEDCTNNVLKNIENGSIVVFHDSKKAFPRLKEALPTILKTLKKEGYTFKCIT